MYKSVNDKDKHLWDVIDLDTGKKIREVQHANDETGEIGILKTITKDVNIDLNNVEKFISSTYCIIKEKRNIKLVKKVR